MNQLASAAATRPVLRNTTAEGGQSGAIFLGVGHRRFSKRRYLGRWAPFCFCLLLSALGAWAAGPLSYTLNWHKISGGGGTSTNATYQVSGTIGQHDASSAMTGGGYSMVGGFWALYAVQTQGAPVLAVTYAGNQAVVSWPSWVTGWTLQTNSNLGTGSWGNYSGTVINNSVTNSRPHGNLFFRLMQ